MRDAITRPAVEVGLGFWNMQSGYIGPCAGPATYRQAATEVRLAEERGFDSVWVAEHHFSHDGYGPSPLTACAFLAGATSRIAVGTCILILPLHDPDRVRAALAAATAIAPGRIRLGVGLGYREVEFTTFGRTLKQRVRRAEASLDELIEAGTLDDVELWMGGVSETAVTRAARYGASIFLPPQIGPPEAIAQLRAAWESHFVPRNDQEPRVSFFVQTWPEADDDVAARIRRAANEEWRSYSRFFVEDAVLGGPESDRDRLAENYVSTSLIGPAGTITDSLLEYRQAGVDTFILWPRFGAMPADTVARSIDRLAADVVPTLRSAR